VLPQRPESREETPKEGICGRSMPHRNNIHFSRIKCKVFLRPRLEIAASGDVFATALRHSIRPMLQVSHVKTMVCIMLYSFG